MRESNSPGGSKSRHWIRDNIIALLALVLSVMSGAASVYVYYSNKADDRTKRSIAEIERLYDRQFLDSVATLIQKANGFIDDRRFVDKNGGTLDAGARFERFWAESASDVEMLHITTKLGAVETCFNDDESCDKKAILTRFPDTVYQAIFFLRRFVFTNELNDTKNLKGWWFGSDIYDFLSTYCAWVESNLYKMNLWDSTREQAQQPTGAKPPEPCLPPRISRS